MSEKTGMGERNGAGEHTAVKKREVTPAPVFSMAEAYDGPDRELRNALRYIELHPDEPEPYLDVLEMVYGHTRDGEKEYHGFNKRFRNEIINATRRMSGMGVAVLDKMNRAYRRSLLMDAKVDFDAFLQYLEIDRPASERFYLPRRRVLSRIVEGFQEVHDSKIDLLTVSQPKRTGKTTIGTWFVLFRAGNAPNGSSVCTGAGDMLVKSFYNGLLDVLMDKTKYLFYDIFPEAKLASTNADEKTINLKEKKRFATITCRPIDGQITGSTEATPDGLIYLDDCVKNEEEAINRDRLNFLWDKVRGDILGRRLEGCPIVAQGTRYSIYDPIGHLQEVASEMEWRTKILEIPALDPVTDESNFEIVKDGKKIFTTEYYRHERQLVSEVQWESQFQQHPFEAKGRLFPADELNRYFELPVNREPDAIVAACDTAEKGSDSVMLPIGYVYGDDVFIEDCVFSNATPEHTKPECATMLVKHKVAEATFESNSTGEYYARDVEALVKQLGGTVSIKLKRSVAKKTTRIEVESDYILKHFYFKDRSLYKTDSEYGMMMKEFTSYTRSGKVPHDDAPDGMSLLSHTIRNKVARTVEVIQRPW